MPKILIADDSRVQVHALSTCLVDRGFEIIVAMDAFQAWSTALRSVPDAILLDINMPAGSGVEVLKKLKHSERTQRIPVVVISGNDEADLTREVTSLGASAFLPKPVDCSQLCEILFRLLGKKTSPEPKSPGSH